ncbi:PEP-CTERM sorting domain-containing protein [Aeoliella sp. SH292]|uniref:PEP-CTERM sorting domain-containing protein n=1 Tax=Aeoliella sp. SH292 TaxID=3454464 RepID=UPI003F9D19B7
MRQLTKEGYYFTEASLHAIDLKTGATTGSVTASEVLQAFPDAGPDALSGLSSYYNRFASSARFIDGGILAGIPGAYIICDCGAGAQPPILLGYVVRFDGPALAPAAYATAGAFPTNPGGVPFSGNFTSFGSSLVASGGSFLDGHLRYDVETLTPVAGIGLIPPPFEAPLNSEFGDAAAANGTVVLKQRRLNQDPQSRDVGIFDFEQGSYLGRIAPPNPSPNDRFGEAIAVDGSVAVVGDPGLPHWQSTENGKAYVFDLATGELVVELVKPNVPSTGDNARADGFGRSVAVGGGLALVGAPTDSTWGNFAGAAFLFDATDGALLHTFKAPLYSSFFGSEVAIDAGRLLIGDGEKVYVYAIPEPSTMVIAMLGLAAIGWRARSSRR